MGLWKLEGYLHANRNRSQFCYDVNIIELAKQYQTETKKTPVIVVDGTNYIHCYYNEIEKQKDSQQRDFLFGGQLRQFVEICQDFVSKFQDRGMELIFYFDGPTEDSKRNLRKIRNEIKLRKVSDIFKHIGSEPCDSSSFRPPLLPVLISATGRFVLKYECNCEVKVSVQDCDLEIAAFAKENDCFAILSQDSDFVILSGARYYFSLQSLDIDAMTTVNYDRIQLAKALSLNMRQLAMFAALLSRNISDETLQNIASALCRKKFPKCSEIVLAFAQLVREKSIVNDFQRSKDNILQYLFSLCRFLKPMKPNELKEWFVTNVEMFDPEKNLAKNVNQSEGVAWNNILNFALQNHITCAAYQDVYNTIQGKPYEIGIVLECFEDKYTSSQIAFRKIRQNIYAILLHEKPVFQEKLEEWGTWDGQPELSSSVKVNKIHEGHPGLRALWKCPDSLNEQRWALLVKSISANLNPVLLKKLETKYLVPTLVLYYIKHECAYVQKWEVEALILQSVSLSTYSTQELNMLNCKVSQCRVINLATLFGAGISTVLFLMSACGFPLREVMPWHYYDGHLFCHVYKNMQNAGFKKAQQKSVMKKYQQVHDIVFS